MDERELNEMLWRSCYLGMRLAFQSLNTPDSFEKIEECVRLLGETARNETTPNQPQFHLAGLEAQTKRLVIGIGNQDSIDDQDLAPRIVAGLGRAATLAEGPAEAIPIRDDSPPLRIEVSSGPAPWPWGRGRRCH
jgi:hypothetical protein